MFVLDCLLALILLPLSPFFYIINLFLVPNGRFRTTTRSAFDICLGILNQNSNNRIGIMASPNEYTDVWTRDAFFSIMGLSKQCENHSAISKTIKLLESKQRSDGLIPLYIGSGSACSKLVCHTKPTGTPKPHYGDAKTGNVVTDSCFQFIILKKGQGPACKKAWNFMQTFVKDGLIYEEGLGSWTDTVYHKGYVLYTNVLYYQAAKMMNKDAETIKHRLCEILWTGEYFNTSSTLKGFDQVGNALAIHYGLVNDSERSSIIKYRLNHFKKGISNPPCLPLPGPVYLPCYMIGNYNYHHEGWSWANLLFISVMDREDRESELQTFTNSVERYGTMFEIYNAKGQPTKQWLCDSQPDFSEAAGMYLLCQDKKVTELQFDRLSEELDRVKRVVCCTPKEIIKNIGFVLIVLSGILQAIRCIVIANGTLSFWAQALVIFSAFFQGTFFYLTKNWQFILIQVGIVVVTSININDIVHARDDFLTSW